MTYLHEVPEARAQPRLPDPVSVAVGKPVFIQAHRLPDLRSHSHLGHSPILPVSRFYWTASPPVAVDFMRDLKFGEHEVATKKAYCRRRGLRYVLATGPLDGEDVERQLARYSSDEDAQAPLPETTKPLVGPRHRAEGGI